MKPKYRIDQFIKFKRNGTASSGDITGVIKRSTGVSYEVDGDKEQEVKETDVIAAYRLSGVKKAAKTVKPKAEKKPRAAAVNTQAGEQDAA
jgi:hypothetical protein